METQTSEKTTFDTQDEFNRKPIAENIIRLLTSDIDLSPMVIDGGWGTGKTEFCQKLIRLMQQQHPDYRPIYIDAFRSDHSGEPLLALLAEIIKSCTPEDTDGQQSERKRLTREISKLVKFGIKTGANALSHYFLKQSVDDLAEEFQQITSDEQEAKNVAETVTDVAAKITDYTIDATVEALLKEQIEAEKNLETLKACLTELAEDKPIILFIDELDRCRPDYAVDMLEVIKHVFDIENVKVVLVTNTKQLRAAINHRYGVEVDAQKYLDKFLKYSFALPEKVVAQTEQYRVWVSIHHFKQLIKGRDIGRVLFSGYEVMECINEMIKRNNLSLRETERLVRFLEIYHSLSHGFGARNELPTLWLRVVGVFIFCFYPSLMDDINKNRTDAGEFAQLFNLQSWPDMPDDPYDVKEVDVIAVMLILNSKIEDSRFILQGYSEQNSYWQARIAEHFGKGKMDLVLSILKETFRVLSFEQAPQ
ncbi:P-loop NTPase fold protein [uncultured Neisseria sp.]|uniref:KAP family P-loop NTPase fold protein n=1 Tax=uncultured Neisseria sp. TaxID=237778 RepID=UPI0028046CEF|nr:P-loop NTPase fold protein [uncultured Neisseria sp.]